MVHTPSSSQLLEINAEFQKQYPIGTALDIHTEGKDTTYRCAIDSYAVLSGKNIQVGVTLRKSGQQEQKMGFIAMDSEGKPAIYYFDASQPNHRKKVAIIASIQLHVRSTHATVHKHGKKVHGVVMGKRHEEEHA